MSLRKEQCNKVCRILDNVLANRPTERDSLIVAVRKAFEALDRLSPSEPRKGRWISVTNGRGGHECDQCHEYAPSWQTREEHLTNYCPNCGAKMEESE